MSAEVLRRAASLMRERAEGATEGPWKNMRGASMGESVAAKGAVIAQMHGPDLRENRRHISSWHPAVALAVADWLDQYADHWEAATHYGITPKPDHPALVVARTYLGEPSC